MLRQTHFTRTRLRSLTTNRQYSMASISHPLLQAFQASKPAFGVWLTFTGTFPARTIAAASSDLSWMAIDCEHGLTSLQPGAAETIAAVSALGPNAPSVIVRIPATGASADGSASWQIKYALDAGARGIVVPMVCAAESANDEFLTVTVGIYHGASAGGRFGSSLSSRGYSRIRQPIYSGIVEYLRCGLPQACQ